MRLQRSPSTFKELSSHAVAINRLPVETLRALSAQSRPTSGSSPTRHARNLSVDSSNGAPKLTPSQSSHSVQQNGRAAPPDGLGPPPPPRVQSSPDVAGVLGAHEAAAYYASRPAHGGEKRQLSPPQLGGSPGDGMPLLWHFQDLGGDPRHGGFRLVSPLGSPLERRASAGARMQAQPMHPSQLVERQWMQQPPSYAVPVSSRGQGMHGTSGMRQPTARSEPDMGAHGETSWRLGGPPPPPPRATQQQRPPQQQQQAHRPRSAGHPEMGRQSEPQPAGRSRSQSSATGQDGASAQQSAGRAPQEAARNGGLVHMNGPRYRVSSQSAPSSPLRRGSSAASGPQQPQPAPGLGYQAVPLARVSAEARGASPDGSPALPLPTAATVHLATGGDAGFTGSSLTGVGPKTFVLVTHHDYL